MGAHVGFELIALGGEVGEHRGQFGELALGGGQRRLGFRHALVDAAALFDARLDLFLQLGIFGVEPLQRDVGVRGLLLLARDVGGKLRQPAIELGDALLGALFLAVEQFARIGEALQPGRGAGFALAQRRQFGGADRLDAGGFGLLAGALGHFANAEVVGLRGFRRRRHGPRSSADGTAWPRPCAPWLRLRGSGWPAGPASSGRPSGRRAGRSRPRRG